MVLAIMRHGRRTAADDSPLLGYHPTRPDESCPEVWESICQLIPFVRQQHFVSIVTSPYLRTRQTAALVQYGLQKYTGYRLPLHVDTRIGEYIPATTARSSATRTDASFDTVTRRYYGGSVPLYRESFESFLRRVREFYRERGHSCIVVTHAGVAEILGALGERDVLLSVGKVAVIPGSQSAAVRQGAVSPLAVPEPLYRSPVTATYRPLVAPLPGAP